MNIRILRKMMIRGIYISLMIYSISHAQYLLPPLYVYESVTENSVLPGSRAAGMGGAQIAAADDGSALWYNPALLTRIRSTEISGTLMHQRFANETTLLTSHSPETRINSTRLGGVWAIFPVRTYRGGMTAGISINRVRNFDRIFRYSSSPGWLDHPFAGTGWGGGEDESGSLWAVSLGGAVEVSPRASVGLSIDILDGEDDWSSFFDSTSIPDFYNYSYSHNINESYTGISGKMGVTYDLSNQFNLSGIIGFPSSIAVEQTSDIMENDYNGLYYHDYWTASYRYTLPFWFGLGAMLRVEDFLLTGDISYMDYSQLEYRSGLADMPRMNQTARRYYDDTFTYRIGGEYRIRPAGVRLRAGYYQEPIPFKGYPIETDPHYFTFGAGFIVDRAINIDLAFLTGSWERDDPSIGSSEKYSAKRFMITVSYRM